MSRVGVKDKIKDGWVSRATRLPTLTKAYTVVPYIHKSHFRDGLDGPSAEPGPPLTHPDTQMHTVYGDDDTPLYKPRGSARSALLTAVRSRRSGLAVHPRWKGTTMGTTRCGP